MTPERETATRAARLHRAPAPGPWDAAGYLLGAARFLYSPQAERSLPEAAPILAGIGRLLEGGPVPAVRLYAYQQRADLPAALVPDSACGPAEQDVLLLSLSLATVPGKEPWPAGTADPQAIRRAAAALTGPIACRSGTLRACAVAYLLRCLPGLSPARQRDTLRRLVWLTDPRTDDPQKILTTLTGPGDPLVFVGRTASRSGSVMEQFPLGDWKRLGTRGETLQLSGRVTAVRRHSRIVFADLAWDDHNVQIGLSPADAREIRTGDLLSVAGRTGLTRSGRNVLSVDVVRQHAPGTPPPPPASLITSGVLGVMRGCLQEAGFREALTPVLTDGYRGGASRPFTTWGNAAGRGQYLRVTSELALLELIAAGQARCYEIGPSFRNEGLRGQAAKEFTMLEAYAADLDRPGMVSQVTRMLTACCPAAPPLREVTFDEAFEQVSGIKPSDSDALRSLASAEIPGYAARVGDPVLLMRRLWRSRLRARLPGFAAITEIPGPASPLIQGQGRAAQRTWLYLHGAEVAEISSNERDPRVLAAAFAAQFAGDPNAVHRDYQQVIEMFAAGLPPVAGAGLGLNRIADLVSRRKNNTPEK